jgi:uncharacterized protein involved in exopolysaccharide biosynthesis
MDNRHIDDTQADGTKASGSPSDLFEYVSILLKWRKFIVYNVLIISVLAFCVTSLLPKWYKATASLLPPKDQGGLNLLGGVSSVLKGVSGLQRMGSLGQSQGAYSYLAILKSRTAMEAVVQKFDLIKVYDISHNSMEDAIKELTDNSSFELQEDENITIEVYDKDPERAAEIANYFAEVLNEISITLGTKEARGNREFIGKRLDSTMEVLRDAENRLQKFQEKTGMMIVPDQNTSSISAVAELYAMKAKKEIEIGILERSLSPNNKILQESHNELDELNKKLSTIPQTGMESFRLYREAAIQQKVVEILVPMYEQAKVEEQKDVPVILVLDKAVPPERKAKPKRLIIVPVCFLLSLFFSVFVAFGVTYAKDYAAQNPKKIEQVRMILNYRRKSNRTS